MQSRLIALAMALVAGPWFRTSYAAAPELENIARRAHVMADSAYSDDYRAEGAVDGHVPHPLARQDLKQAWCVRASETGGRAEFTLTWDQPVQIAEVAYFGRTGHLLEECFKDFEVYLDEATEPAARGTLEPRPGAQRISVPTTTARKLRISFLSAYTDRFNPGASEIAVFSAVPSDEQLAAMSVAPEERTPQSAALRDDLLQGQLGFQDLLVVQHYPLHISHVYVYHVEGYQPGGGIYIFTPNKDGGKLRCVVDSSQGMILSADLSYDGKEVVFAWKRGGLELCNPVAHIEDIDRSVSDNNYQIYRVNIDGTGLTQLTSGPHNNLDPCWLPDGGIAYISDRKPAYAYCYVVTSPVVYRMDRDGKQQRRLSANYLMDFTPSVLNDGRIIYTRWEYVDRPACPIQSLWTLNPDGTGLTGYYGNRVITPGTFMDAQPVPGTNQVIAIATNHNGSCRGAVVSIDPANGANAPESVRNLTPETDIYAHRMGGGPFGNGMLDTGQELAYEKPHAIDANRYFVSRHGALQLRTFDGHAATILTPQDGMGFYCAQPIRPTPIPPVLTGGPMDQQAVLPEDGSVRGDWATVFMQDVYNGLEPEVERGEIKQIAVIQEMEKNTHSPQNNMNPDGSGMRNIASFGFQFPLVSCGATYAPKQVWGFADVKPDGSAAFRVPAEVPIYFLALDGEGRTVQRMRTFTHFMPGEVQTCIGCHANRNSVAPHGSRVPALDEMPQELVRPDWGVKGFSYPEVVQPVLDRHCISCHNEREQPGGVDLSGDLTDFFNVSYDVLCRTDTLGAWHWDLHGTPSGPEFDALRGKSPYIEWIWTINGAGHNITQIAPRRWGSPASLLAEIVRNGHSDPSGTPRINVPDEDRRKVFLWMDLNIPYYGTSASSHKDRLGSRRMYPDKLDSVLAEVAGRRCVTCHQHGIPRKFFTRILAPESNNFLMAPLAKEAGGTERCGVPVFRSRDDIDYQTILQQFESLYQFLKQSPRADMLGADTPP